MPGKKRGRPKAIQSGDERETVIHMKGTAEYVDWLDAIHRETLIPKVQIFRQAIREWAEKRKKPAPPER